MKVITRLEKGSQHVEAGQGLVEYALILVLVAILVIGVLALMGPAVGDVYRNLTIALQNDPQQMDLATAVSSCVTDPGAKNPLLNTIANRDLDDFKATLELKKGKMSTSCYNTLKSLANSL